MKKDRPQIRDLNDLEVYAEIKRTEMPSFTRRQAQTIERKILGPSWGRKRRKMTGWPK